MKIFVVEDEAEIRKELSVLLQKYGYAYESSTDFAHGGSKNIPFSI